MCIYFPRVDPERVGLFVDELSRDGALSRLRLSVELFVDELSLLLSEEAGVETVLSLTRVLESVDFVSLVVVVPPDEVPEGIVIPEPEEVEFTDPRVCPLLLV